MECGKGAFAYEDSIEVASYADFRDDHKDESDADAQGCNIVKQGNAGLSQAVYDAGQCSI